MDNQKTINTTFWLVALMACGICCGGSSGIGVIVFYFLFKHYTHMKDCVDTGDLAQAHLYRSKLMKLLTTYALILAIILFVTFFFSMFLGFIEESTGVSSYTLSVLLQMLA